MHQCGACRHAFHLRCCAKNDSNTTHVQLLLSCQRITPIICFAQYGFFYNLNSAIYFSDSITPRSSKLSSRAYLPMKMLNCLEIHMIPALEKFHLHPLRNRSIFLCIPMHEMQFGKPKSSQNLCGEWRMNPGIFLYDILDSALFWLNAEFLHTQFYIKFTFFGLLSCTFLVQNLNAICIVSDPP